MPFKAIASVRSVSFELAKSAQNNYRGNPKRIVLKMCYPHTRKTIKINYE